MRVNSFRTFRVCFLDLEKFQKLENFREILIFIVYEREKFNSVNGLHFIYRARNFEYDRQTKVKAVKSTTNRARSITNFRVFSSVLNFESIISEFLIFIFSLMGNEIQNKLSHICALLHRM